MSLLCDYSDSSASDASDDEQQSVAVTVSEELPSVDDLFSSSISCVLSSSAGSMPTGNAPKRQAGADLKHTEPKRVRTEAATTVPDGNVQRTEAPKPPKPVRHFAPPQLKRPNVSTEDLGAWNTQKTMQHHERKQKTGSS